MWKPVLIENVNKSTSIDANVAFFYINIECILYLLFVLLYTISNWSSYIYIYFKSLLILKLYCFCLIHVPFFYFLPCL